MAEKVQRQQLQKVKLDKGHPPLTRLSTAKRSTPQRISRQEGSNVVGEISAAKYQRPQTLKRLQLVRRQRQRQKRGFMMPAWSQKRLPVRKASQNRPQNPRHLALRQGRSASREEEVRSIKSALMRPHPRVNRRERAMGRIRSGAAKSGVRLNIMFKLK